MQLEVSHLNEECGVFGVWGTPDAAFLTYTGLFSLQHRGQEGPVLQLIIMANLEQNVI
jgi:amidophosphoribosyltransferase